MAPRQRVPNEQLRQLITEVSWTLDAMARAVNACAAESGLSTYYDRTSVAHWLSGTRPRDQVTALISEALSRKLHRVVTVTELGLQRPNGQPATPEWSKLADPITGLTTLTRADVDPAHRVALRQLVYETRALTPPDWQQASKHRHTSPPRTVDRPPIGRATTGAAEHMVRLFSSSIRRFGGQHARSALVAYLAEDVVASLNTVAPCPRCSEIRAAAADLVLLAGFMSFDGQAHGLAQRYYRVALALAVEADDPVRYAIGLGLLSHQASYLSQHRAALALATAALNTTEGSAPAQTKALLHAHTAVCHAALEHPRDAQHHLERAQYHLDGATEPALPISVCRPAELAYCTAQVHILLGNRNGAITALRSALRHNPVSDHHTRALILAMMAGHQIDLGELDHACNTWHRFLDIYPGLYSARTDITLVGMYRRLQPLGANPVVRTLLTRAVEIAPELPNLRLSQGLTTRWPLSGSHGRDTPEQSEGDFSGMAI
jgi:tetratricopeptide (TPR) repeat protein